MKGVVVSCKMRSRPENSTGAVDDSIIPSELKYQVRYSNGTTEDYPHYVLMELIVFALVEVGSHVVIYSYEMDRHFHCVVKKVDDSKTTNILASFETTRSDWIDLRRFKFQIISPKRMPNLLFPDSLCQLFNTQRKELVHQGTQTTEKLELSQSSRPSPEQRQDQSTQTDVRKHDQSTQTTQTKRDHSTQTIEEIQTKQTEKKHISTQTRDSNSNRDQSTQTVEFKRDQSTQTVEKKMTQDQCVQTNNKAQQHQTTQTNNKTLQNQTTQTLAQSRRSEATQTCLELGNHQATQTGCDWQRDQITQTVFENKAQSTQTLQTVTKTQHTQTSQTITKTQHTQTSQTTTKTQHTQTSVETRQEQAAQTSQSFISMEEKETQTIQATSPTSNSSLQEVQTSDETQHKSTKAEVQGTSRRAQRKSPGKRGAKFDTRTRRAPSAEAEELLDSEDEGDASDKGKADDIVLFDSLTEDASQEEEGESSKSSTPSNGPLLVLKSPPLASVKKNTRLAILWDMDEEYYEATVLEIRKYKSRTIAHLEYTQDTFREWAALGDREFYILSDFMAYEKYLNDQRIGCLPSENIRKIKNNEEQERAYGRQQYEWIRDPFTRIEIPLDTTSNADLYAAHLKSIKAVRVGSRIAIWWVAEKRFYKGNVIDVRTRKGIHQYQVKYDDNDKLWVNLEKNFFFVLLPPQQTATAAGIVDWGAETDEEAKAPTKESLAEESHEPDGKPDLESIHVGSQIEVNVSWSRRYKIGTVKDIKRDVNKFLVAFEFGHAEWISLEEVDFRLSGVTSHDTEQTQPKTGKRKSTGRQSTGSTGSNKRRISSSSARARRGSNSIDKVDGANARDSKRKRSPRS